MKRYISALLFVSLILLSCQNDESVHDDLYNIMESYVYNNEEDIYGFEEIGRFAQKATMLSRDTDIYIIQDDIKDVVNQRLALVAHTYFVHNAGKSYNIKKSLLEIDGKDLKVCPNSKYADLYLTQDEIDCMNRLYYRSIPDQLKMVKNLESRKFNGFRYYYACKYRKKLNDRYKVKQYIVYENNNEYDIYELKYDYDLLRSYIRAIESVDLKDPYIVSLCKKNDGWNSYEKYRNIFNRLSIDVLDYSAISGY